jgi:divalent metal cation (Fe/Co/Zn/Cd) transporter
MGPDYILANISLHVASHVDRAQAHDIFARIDGAIKRRYPKIKRVFIESESESDVTAAERQTAGTASPASD